MKIVDIKISNIKSDEYFKKRYNKITPFTSLFITKFICSFTYYTLPKPFYPNSGVMPINTKIIGSQKGDLALILTNFSIYLKNLQTLNKSNVLLLDFVEKTIFRNPKIFQHVAIIAFPNLKFSRCDLESRFKNICIYDPKSQTSADWDLVIAFNGANLAKKNPLFYSGRFYSLGFSDKQNYLANKLPYEQTGQPNPDYFYIFNNEIYNWSRYYDFKTGKFEVNKGHIICATNEEDYDNFSKKLLLGLKTCYNKKHKSISDNIESLITDKSLSWEQRNILFQEFIRDNLQKYPDINPSFILKNKLLYENNIQKPYPQIMTITNNSDCLADISTSQNTIAKSIISSGKETVEGYMSHPGSCENIKKAMVEIITESMATLKMIW